MYNTPANVTLIANASSSTATISKVEFYLDSVLLDTVDEQPVQLYLEQRGHRHLHGDRDRL